MGEAGGSCMTLAFPLPAIKLFLPQMYQATQSKFFSCHNPSQPGTVVWGLRWVCLCPRDRPATDSSAELICCCPSTKPHKQVSAEPCALVQMSADWSFQSYSPGHTFPSARRRVPWPNRLFNLHHFTVQSWAQSDREVGSAPTSIHKQPHFYNIHRSNSNDRQQGYIKTYIMSGWMSETDKNQTSQSWSSFTWMASNPGHLSNTAPFLG